MPTIRRQKRPIAFQPNAHAEAETRFPAAVLGEEYDRYVRATWAHADRWFQRQATRISAPDLTMHEAREILWSVAAADVTRRLHPQEERLLSELLQKEWPYRAALLAQLEPEIPSFLLKAPRSAD